MESKINSLEKESKMYRKNNKKHYFPSTLLTGIPIMSIGISLIIYLLVKNNMFTSNVETIFGTMNSAVFNSTVFSAIILPIIVLQEIQQYKLHKDLQKKEKGINSELEYLKEQIVYEREKLNNLKKNKSRDKENRNFRVVEVNDLEKLKLLREYCNLYFDLGYNRGKYYKYHQQNKLEKKLKRKYTTDGMELVEEYLHEKDPKLVKRKEKSIH